MAEKKISELPALAATPDPLDVYAVVDVDDLTSGPSGTTKKVTFAEMNPQDPNWLYGAVQTTSGSQTVIFSVPLDANTTYFFRATIVGRRVGGSAGSPGNSYGGLIYATYQRLSGNAIQVGSTNHTVQHRSDASYTFIYFETGSTVQGRVIGAINQTLEWNGVLTWRTQTG